MSSVRLEVNGRKDGCGYLVQVNGSAFYLSGVLFKMLAILALERVRADSDGWVNTKDLHLPGFNAARYMWKLQDRIKTALESTSAKSWKVAESDKQKKGRYRLLVDPRRISFPNLPALDEFDNHSITIRLRGPMKVFKT